LPNHRLLGLPLVLLLPVLNLMLSRLTLRAVLQVHNLTARLVAVLVGLKWSQLHRQRLQHLAGPSLAPLVRIMRLLLSHRVSQIAQWHHPVQSSIEHHLCTRSQQLWLRSPMLSTARLLPLSRLWSCLPL